MKTLGDRVNTYNVSNLKPIDYEKGSIKAAPTMDTLVEAALTKDTLVEAAPIDDTLVQPDKIFSYYGLYYSSNNEELVDIRPKNITDPN